MNHSFNVDVAVEYGIDAAVLIENIGFWLKKNQSNEKHFHDGYTWTFNSSEAFHDLFPYMSAQKIKRVLKALEEKEVLKSGIYNKLSFDRTKWYTIIKKEIADLYNLKIALFKNEQSDGSEMNNGKFENEPTIPDINPDEFPDKYNIQFETIIDYINETTESSYRKKKGSSNHKLIISRLKEGYTVDQLKLIVSYKNKQWKDDSKMKEYIRPSTLFRPSHIEDYLNQAQKGFNLVGYNKKVSLTCPDCGNIQDSPRTGGALVCEKCAFPVKFFNRGKDFIEVWRRQSGTA